MSFMDAVKSVFSKYAKFSGRARRSEYWYFFLFNYIVTFVLTMLTNISEGLAFLSTLWMLVTLVPTLAVSWRRMHDIGKSGGWYFINLIPLVGQIIWIVLCVKDSQPGDNTYGPNPKGVGSASCSAPASSAPAADPWAVTPEAPKAAAPAAEEDDEFSRLMKSFKDSE